MDLFDHLLSVFIFCNIRAGQCDIAIYSHCLHSLTISGEVQLHPRHTPTQYIECLHYDNKNNTLDMSKPVTSRGRPIALILMSTL